MEETLDALKAELDSIHIKPASIKTQKTSTFSDESYPLSYRENNEKEKNLLLCCENFQRQYSHLYPDRKPLLLSPKNECGVEKFVCTTIRPTMVRYQEMYDYSGCASFVADYLTFQPLDPPIDLPSVIRSPTTVLKEQQGTCFDFAVLLCSLLVGLGYDAYCVSGYASKEITLVDETREVCPLATSSDQSEVKDKIRKAKKYSVKPPKDLHSQYEAKMEAKQRNVLEAEQKRKDEEERQRIAVLEKVPVDKLWGLRVHCWVLVLSGKRQVPENLFIEPLTGDARSTEHTQYLGVENVWNHKNLWVNMQDCAYGVKNLSYDLADSMKWEFMFPNRDGPLVVIPNVNEEILEIEEDEEGKDVNYDETVNIPPSWVSKIEISPEDFKRRCPLGKKTILYKKAKLEKFSEYLNEDGLVARVSLAEDAALTTITEIHEYYKNRADKLEKRVRNLQTGWIYESFAPGRDFSLKEHAYKGESERIMHFFSNARVDGLSKREENEFGISETFVDREDRLLKRSAVYGKREKKFEPQKKTMRPLSKMVESFGKDTGTAEEQVSERQFLLSEDRIHLRYHLLPGKITSSHRDFMKPPNFSLDKNSQLQFSMDMMNTYQADPQAKPVKELYIYNLFVELLHAEKKCQDLIYESTNEVQEILGERMREEMSTVLSVSVYDTERNEKAKLRREDLAQQQQEEEQRKRELELDYLAPFLARMGNPQELTRADALKLREECLNDLKQRLIDKANLIQSRFEKETLELQQRQAAYQENQMNMTKEDEDEYLNFCSESMFKVHILELRLNRHKELAPQKYTSLDETLRKDHRLAPFINN